MKPSRWWHLVSVFVFLLCVVVIPGIMLFQMLSLFRAGMPLFTLDEFALPGVHVMELQVPGYYVVRSLISGKFGDKPYKSPEGLPTGARLRIADQATGKELRQEKTQWNNCGFFNSTYASICEFSIAKPGKYSITLENSSEERVIMVTYSLLETVLLSLLKAILVFIAGWVLPSIISTGIEVLRYIDKRKSVKSVGSHAP